MGSLSVVKCLSAARRSAQQEKIMSHTLEVYMESYNTIPIVHEMKRTLSVSIGDEISREDWVGLISTPGAALELKVKVEDVRHLFWDEDDLEHTVSIRVVPVE